MKTLKDLKASCNIHETKWVETNAFADPQKANNGGGYSQPLIIGTVNGVPFELHDTSCGDFGDRANLELGGFSAQYSLIGEDYEYSSIPRKYLHLVEAINETYNTSFITKEMNWIEKFNDEVNYALEGCTADYSQSIDRDQAIHNDKAAYDYYQLIDKSTLEEEVVTAGQMEDWAKSW